MDIRKSLGQPMSIHSMRAYCENPPQGAEQTMNGRSAVKRIKDLAKRAEQAQQAKMLDRYTRLHDYATAKVDDADETLDLVEEKIDGWMTAMKAGRLNPDDVIDNIAQLPPVLKAISETYDEAAGDAEAAYDFIDQDPADFQADQTNRFPALEKSLPLVTEAWLRGEPDASDPLAPPNEPDSEDVSAVGEFLQTGRGEQS